MADFDAELYLRLAGERALLSPGGEQGPSENAELGAAAHALVAVGAMTAGSAQGIVDDYDLASACRSSDHHHLQHRRLRRAVRRAASGPGLPALRAVPCHRLIEQPWGEWFLRYVVLSDEATALHVTMRPAAPPGGPSGLRPTGAGWAAAAPLPAARAVTASARDCPAR